MGGGQLYSTKSRPLILYVVVFFSTLICFIFDFLITISFFFFFFRFCFSLFLCLLLLRLSIILSYLSYNVEILLTE